MAHGMKLPKGERDKIVGAIRAGKTRHYILKQEWCTASPHLITTIAQEEGLKFQDNPGTKKMLEKRVEAMKERRLDVQERLLARTETVLARLEAPEYTYEIAVAGKGVQKVTTTNPPAADERNLANSINAYANLELKLDDRNVETEAGKQRTLLGQLADALGLAD